ncbi:N-acetyltransferase [bacterium]|nr:MAG: N-acetyltransferase [bacterium]
MAQRLVGAKTRLVPLDFDRHFENLLAWMGDPDVSDGLPTGNYPKSRPSAREWFEARQRGGEREAAFAIETLEGEHVGYTALYGIDFVNGSCGSGSMIAKSDWGQGLGTDAAHVRAHFAFRVLNLRQIYSSYLGGNERSARMQRAVGAIEWGRQPEAIWRLGRYVDHIHTVLTRENWERSRPTPGVPSPSPGGLAP